MTTYTLLHVLISLAGILSGFIVLFGFFTGNRLEGWTVIFLTTTTLTSVTGFLFPFHGLTPGLIISALSLVILTIAICARYVRRLAGGWRKAYVISAVAALYFNVFVLIVQLFLKVPALKEIAHTQKEPPFAIAQFSVLALFIACGVVAALKFHDKPIQTV